MAASADELRARLIDRATYHANGRYTPDEVVDLVRRMVGGEPDAVSLLLSFRECTADLHPEVLAAIDALEGLE